MTKHDYFELSHEGLVKASLKSRVQKGKECYFAVVERAGRGKKDFRNHEAKTF